MARNRKRAKERRARRPHGASVAARTGLDHEGTPDPIEHATPDVELAEAQLAVGRPELAGESEQGEDASADDQAFADQEFGEAGPEIPGVLPGQVRVETDDTVGEGAPGGGGELVSAGPTTPAAEHRGHLGHRLITFLQGSWRELQRVQWPDRRQVMQATGVVIGFVIVAGVFLGVADFLAGKLVNYILK